MGAGEILTGWSWGSVLLALLVIMLVYFIYPVVFPTVTGIPGPPAFPLIGSLIPYIKNGQGFQDIANIRKYGKVFKLLVARDEVVVVADTEILKHVLVKDFTDFTDRTNHRLMGIFEWSLFHAKGATWRRLRRLLTPSFTSGKLKKMAPLVNKCVDQLVNNLENKAINAESIDIRNNAGAFTLDVIASIAFGLELDSQNDPNNPFITHAKKVFAIKLTDPLVLVILFLPFLVPFFEKAGFTSMSKEAFVFYGKFLDKVIQERKGQKNVRQDFLQLMLDAGKYGLDEEGKEDLRGVEAEEVEIKTGLSSTEIVAQAVFFFLAAYDTTATTMSFLLYNLAINQECQDKVYKEVMEVMQDQDDVDYECISKLPYLDQCIQETLRMYPPLIRSDRQAKQDIDIKGVHIPKGTIVGIPIYAIHHNPEVWPQPDKFDPERFSPDAIKGTDPFNYLPFGLGPRQCIGMRLALMEIKLAMVKVIQKFKFKDAHVPLDIDTGILIRSRSGIWVQPELR